MYWYNPKTRELEHRPVPTTDAEARRILDDPLLIEVYEGYRASRQNLEISLLFAAGTAHFMHTGRRAPQLKC